MHRLTAAECDELLQAEGNSVWRLIVRMLGDDGHDAADCFQQTFVEFVARRKRSGDVRNAASLLKRIAAARVIDVVRRRIRDRGRIENIDPALIPGRAEFEPETQAGTNELLTDLRLALVDLPVRQSTAFAMTQIDDVPYEEVAAAMGITVRHLRVLLHRARIALCQRLKAHDPRREVRP